MSEPPNTPPKQPKLSPILGLPIDDEPDHETSIAAPEPRTPDPGPAPLQLSVIVPARNEEHNLPGCLATLLAQNDDIFPLGADWELLIVDDASTDRTRAIAEEAAAQHPAVRVLEAPSLAASQGAFTGKNNACWFAAQHARGRWFLFTDADTLHEPNDLRHALHEADKYKVVLLSYSPRQILSNLAQRMLMPLIFSELASVYPYAEVNDPARRTAAANGQFLLVERNAYFAAGGHRAVGGSVLEDLELAWNFKRAKRPIRFRYAPDAVSTRMYRGLDDMMEGWTRSLALVFPNPLRLAAWRLLDILLLLLPLLLYLLPYLVLWQKTAIILLWLRTVIRFYTRVARAHMSFVNSAISVFGLPFFIVLLVRSWMQHHLFHHIAWKGRAYHTGR